MSEEEGALARNGFPQTREEFDAYKARPEAAGFTVLTRWRKGLKSIRLGDIVLSEEEQT